ncbi:YhcN/YlaJ family sporulation lipoprotein [Marinisporobacter balticus]|uniref:YhcN/YlaJ family sporulation lipoprotein n=1 Tax=Marinisporobacter balticus TaxID=2018667 RepID=A0A4R2L0J1_9FIRM|nr:YhcN/YlaJ family sporulation lipoprotein [Marinisporobacter balticus]TCO78697.1 YhcN/YlaJ family sporulation lipoprotein [Marinisporobacter balticus]
MKKKIKQISIVVTFLIFASFLAIGCAPAQKPVPRQNDYNPNDTNIDMYDKQITQREGNNYGLNGTREDLYNNQNVPDGYEDQNLTYDNTPNNLGNNLVLEREIEKISGVKDAVVVVDNTTAYVGIETDAAKNMNTKAMQTNVANMIKDRMPNIKTVSITTERDRVEKLRGYTRDITSGKPVRDFIDRIRDLF